MYSSCSHEWANPLISDSSTHMFCKSLTKELRKQYIRKMHLSLDEFEYLRIDADNRIVKKDSEMKSPEPIFFS